MVLRFVSKWLPRWRTNEVTKSTKDFNKWINQIAPSGSGLPECLLSDSGVSSRQNKEETGSCRRNSFKWRGTPARGPETVNERCILYFFICRDDQAERGTSSLISSCSLSFFTGSSTPSLTNLIRPRPHRRNWRAPGSWPPFPHVDWDNQSASADLRSWPPAGDPLHLQQCVHNKVCNHPGGPAGSILNPLLQSRTHAVAVVHIQGIPGHHVFSFYVVKSSRDVQLNCASWFHFFPAVQIH